MHEIEKEKHLKMRENIQRNLNLRGIVIPRVDLKAEDYSDITLYLHDFKK